LKRAKKQLTVNLAEDKEVGRRRVVVGLLLVNGDGGEFV
jgi:hypothetical protein